MPKQCCEEIVAARELVHYANANERTSVLRSRAPGQRPLQSILGHFLVRGWREPDSPEAVANVRAEARLGSLEALRPALRATGRVTIEPVLPVDPFCTCVLLPLPPAAREPT